MKYEITVTRTVFPGGKMPPSAGGTPAATFQTGSGGATVVFQRFESELQS